MTRTLQSLPRRVSTILIMPPAPSTPSTTSLRTTQQLDEAIRLMSSNITARVARENANQLSTILLNHLSDFELYVLDKLLEQGLSTENFTSSNLRSDLPDLAGRILHAAYGVLNSTDISVCKRLSGYHVITNLLMPSRAAGVKSRKSFTRYIRRVNSKLALYYLSVDGIALNVKAKPNLTMKDLTGNPLFDVASFTTATGSITSRSRYLWTWSPILARDIITLVNAMVTIVRMQHESTL